jgi:hypothetical protein
VVTILEDGPEHPPFPDLNTRPNNIREAIAAMHEVGAKFDAMADAVDAVKQPAGLDYHIKGDVSRFVEEMHAIGANSAGINASNWSGYVFRPLERSNELYTALSDSCDDAIREAK